MQKYLVATRKRQPRLSTSFDLHLNGSPLERVESYRYLGIVITMKLSWSTHKYSQETDVSIHGLTLTLCSVCILLVSDHILNMHANYGIPTQAVLFNKLRQFRNLQVMCV